MTIIPEDNEIEQNKSRIAEFVKHFGIIGILHRFGADKDSGYSLRAIWDFVFSMVFTGLNLYRTLDSDRYCGMGKDVVYRFLNSVKTNWEKVLLHISMAAIAYTRPLTSEKRRNAIVIDDSCFYRNRSKAVELLCNAYDHAKHLYYKGYRMLTLGWTDGVDFIPFAFQLMSSSDPKKRLCESKTFDGRTIAARRRKSAVTTMPERVLELLRQAKAAMIPADYVLFDSWFSSPSALISIRKIGYHVVSMLKKGKTKYTYMGEALTVSQIFKSLPKRRGRSKFLSSAVVTIKDSSGENSIRVMLIFVRNTHKKKDWKVLVSTDIFLTEEEVIELYGKRWSIEVFFKTCKSYLKLASEYQGRSYDMLVAHSTIVFIRFIMLSWFSRQDTDHRTINEGFFQMCEEKADVSFSDALRYLFAVLQDALAEIFWLNEEMVDEILDAFLAKLPSSFRFALISTAGS